MPQRSSRLPIHILTSFTVYIGLALGPGGLGGAYAQVVFDSATTPNYQPAATAAPTTAAPSELDVGSPDIEANLPPASDDNLKQPAEAAAEPSDPHAQQRTPSSAPVADATPPEALGGEVIQESGFKVTGAPGQGLTVSTGEAFSLNIKSRLLIKYQLNTFDDPNKDAQQLVNIGTARIWLGGNVYRPELTYQIQLAVAGKDYRDGATSPIFDAYMEWKAHRDFAMRAGQYFVPFDRLRTVREWGLQMAERPRPVQEFTLDRDVGVTFFSENFLGDSSPVAWYLSAFGGHGTNQVNPAAVSGLLTGRLELRPLGPIDDDREGDLDRRERPGLALGVGVARNFKSNRVRGTTGPTFVGGSTSDTYIAADAVFKWMGFAMQAEYLHKDTSEQSFETEQANGDIFTEYTREGGGWILQASYAFDPPFEVVARLSRLYFGSTLEPAFITDVNRRGSEVAGGLNYYFNGHRMKVQTTWVARTNAALALSDADHSGVAQLDVTF